MSVNASDSGVFSFGVQELARAADRELAARTVTPVGTQPKVRTPAIGGFDPYNSTGGFDRRNAWNRIRKR